MLLLSINLKRQSEHSGLRPDTNSLVIFKSSAFDTICYFFEAIFLQTFYARLRNLIDVIILLSNLRAV